MKPEHLSGGAIGALVGYCSIKFGWGLSSDEAGTIGLAAFAVGAWVAHLATGPGIVPAFRRGLFGEPKPDKG